MFVSRSGPVCSVNNKGRVEHHQEFWILVAGDELEWVETGHCDHDHDNALTHNIVPLPGNNNNTGNYIGMFGDIIGTVNKCKVLFFR